MGSINVKADTSGAVLPCHIDLFVTERRPRYMMQLRLSSSGWGQNGPSEAYPVLDWH